MCPCSLLPWLHAGHLGLPGRAQSQILQGKQSQLHLQVLWHRLLSLRRHKAGTPKAGTVPAAAGAASTGEQQLTSAAVAAEQPASPAPAGAAAAEAARGSPASQGMVLPSLAWLPDGSAVAAVDMWGNVAVVDLQCRQLPLQYGAVEASRAAETLQVQMHVACRPKSAATQPARFQLGLKVCFAQDAPLHSRNVTDLMAVIVLQAAASPSPRKRPSFLRRMGSSRLSTHSVAGGAALPYRMWQSGGPTGERQAATTSPSHGVAAQQWRALPAHCSPACVPCRTFAICSAKSQLGRPMLLASDGQQIAICRLKPQAEVVRYCLTNA